MSQNFLKDKNHLETVRRTYLLLAASALMASGNYTSEGAVLEAKNLENWIEKITDEETPSDCTDIVK
jgi:hypothetical protein